MGRKELLLSWRRRAEAHISAMPSDSGSRERPGADAAVQLVVDRFAAVEAEEKNEEPREEYARG